MAPTVAFTVGVLLLVLLRVGVGFSVGSDVVVVCSTVVVEPFTVRDELVELADVVFNVVIWCMKWTQASEWQNITRNANIMQNVLKQR